MILSASIIHKLREYGLLPERSVLRRELQGLIQHLMEIEVSSLIDADYYERNHRRQTYRNGYRQRRWKSSLGMIDLNIPKLRQGTYLPTFLQPEIEDDLIPLMISALLTQVSISELADVMGWLDYAQRYHFALIQDYLHDRRELLKGEAFSSLKPHQWLDAIALSDNASDPVVLLAVNFDDNGEFCILDYELGRSAEDETAWIQLLRRVQVRGLVECGVVLSPDVADLRRQIHHRWPESEWFYQPLHSLEDHLKLWDNDVSATDAVSRLTIPIPQIHLGGLALLPMGELEWQSGYGNLMAVA